MHPGCRHRDTLRLAGNYIFMLYYYIIGMAHPSRVDAFCYYYVIIIIIIKRRSGINPIPPTVIDRD